MLWHIQIRGIFLCWYYSWVYYISDFAGSNGRRESQGSLSSGASLELGTSGSGRNEVSLERDITT